MRNVKRILALLLAMIMVIGLAACGKTTPPAASSTTKPAASSTTKPAASSTTKPAESKAVDPPAPPAEPVTITIGIPAKANVTEFDNNKLVLWLEEETGYDIEVVTFAPAQAEYLQQLGVMVAGNESCPTCCSTSPVCLSSTAMMTTS